MKAKDLVDYLNKFIEKSDSPDDLEVTNGETGEVIQVIKLNLEVDSNGISDESISIQ